MPSLLQTSSFTRLHESPELAFHEFETAAIIRKELASISGLTVLDRGVGGTGIIAVIKGEAIPEAHGAVAVKKTILFRADLDGLPIGEKAQEKEDEETGNPLAKKRRLGAPCCGLCGAFKIDKGKTDGSTKKSAPPATLRKWKKQTWSQKPNASHACGHDGHMAMLVGAARILAKEKKSLYGNIVLLFQPAEERHSVNNPMGGAIRMIRDISAGEELTALLSESSEAAPTPSEPLAMDSDEKHKRDNTEGYDTSMDGKLLERVDEVYGAHLWNYATAGTLGCAPGSITANSDSLEITVQGTGGHASAPQGTVDAVVVAAQLVTALQGIVSRNVSPTESAVVTLGKIEGGFAPNVIANQVRIMGTVRTFTMPVKRLVRRRIQEIGQGIAASHGGMCHIDIRFLDGYPACVNEASCAEHVLSAASNILPTDMVGAPTPNMAGEDFAFFLHRKPGAFFFVGSNPDAIFGLDPTVDHLADVEVEHGTKKTVAHHTPEFDIHEGSLWCGAATWVALARARLAPHVHQG